MSLGELCDLVRAPENDLTGPVRNPAESKAAGEQPFLTAMRTLRLPGRVLKACLGLLGTAAVLAVVGCGVTEDLPTTAITAQEIPGKTVNGNVHGGVFPISNATITLMETQTTSPGSYGAAAKALLTTTSNQYGYFTFPDTGWTCTSTEYAYIVVTGGHSNNISTANAVNNHVVEVGVIGPCTLLANQAEIDTVNVFISELSTVAAAAALGNFMQVIDADKENGLQVVNIGAPANNSATGKCATSPSNGTSSCTAAGLAHAFTNAVTLVDSVRTNNSFPTGMANTYNASNTTSAIPNALINTIGNILQQCVDSVDTVPTPPATTPAATPSAKCTALFAAATPPVGTTPVGAGSPYPSSSAPVDTLEAALEMMKFPTGNNPKYGTTTLYNQVGPFAPFSPSLESAPTSFSISIFYGVTLSGSNTPYPIDLALDANDDAYVVYTNYGGSTPVYSAINEWTASGTSGFVGTQNKTYVHPVGIAIDVSGAVYVTNNDTTTTANSVVLGLSGTTLYPLTSFLGASGLAVDNKNDLFVSSVTGGTSASISEYTQANLILALNASVTAGGATVPGVLAKSTSATYGAVSGLALDKSQNVWGAGISGTAAGVFLWPKTSSTTAPYTSGAGSMTAFTGKTGSFSVALNGTGTAYFPLDDTLAQATYISSTLNTNASLETTAAAVPHRSQVDGAGNVFWTDLENSGLLYEYTPGSTPQLMSMLPCFPYPTASGLVCLTTAGGTSNYTPSDLRAMGIDSAGDVWYAADAGFGAVIETLGLAAPTWPLLAYGNPGTLPQ